MQNNRPAMDRFLASIERRAFRMAQIATGNTEDALDIVQEAMLGLVQRYSRRPEGEWKPLFFRILQSRISDWHRRKRVRNRWLFWLDSREDPNQAEEKDPITNLPDTNTPNPSEQLVLGDSIAAVDSALRTLPLRQQQAFLLRAWEGLGVRQTARAMRCSEGSVKTHYSRALRALRGMLEEH